MMAHPVHDARAVPLRLGRRMGRKLGGFIDQRKRPGCQERWA